MEPGPSPGSLRLFQAKPRLSKPTSEVHHVATADARLALRSDRAAAQLLSELFLEHHDFSTHHRHQGIDGADLILRDRHVVRVQDDVVSELPGLERSELILP